MEYTIEISPNIGETTNSHCVPKDSHGNATIRSQTCWKVFLRVEISLKFQRKMDESQFKDLVTFLDRNKKPDNIIDIATKHVTTEETFLKNKKYGFFEFPAFF